MFRELRRSLCWGLLLCVAVLGCGDHRRTAPERPNVVLLVVDTLRYDHVGCYGSRRDTTPAVDGLASEAIRFDRAYSTAPWTMPAVASMFTGLYPRSCRSPGTWGSLAEGLPTLAEIFRDRGYATAGIISHFLINARFKFDRGFEIFIDDEAEVEAMHDHVSTENLTRQAAQVLRQIADESGQPFFLFVHYFDPHYNYKRHPEYGFAAPRAGRLDGTQSMEQLRGMLPDMSAAEIEFLRSLYDEEIRHADAGIDELLELLRRSGLYDDTIVVVVSDHGEEFLEHGWLGHTRTLYEELVRVPLIIRVPWASRVGDVVDTPVSLVSLAPTLLDLAGIDPSGFDFHGSSFAALIDGEDRAVSPEPAICEVQFKSTTPTDRGKDANKVAIIVDRFKLVVDRSGATELFDLRADPNETRNLAPDRGDLVEQLMEMMSRRLEATRQPATAAESMPLTDEEIERLRSLGYIGR